MVGLSDEDPTRVRELAALWGAPVEADWRRLLELPDVELAYVFSPHDRMAETCLALIERRIPFVVEKPLGTSLKQLQQVRRAAGEAQRTGHRAADPAGRSGGQLAGEGRSTGVPAAVVHRRSAGALRPQRQRVDARPGARRWGLPGQPGSALRRSVSAAQRPHHR